MNQRELIAKILGDFLDPSKRYHSELPRELEAWYAYTTDGGHSILCLLKDDAYTALASHAVKDYLIPCPVRAVVNAGYQNVRGYIVTDLPYDRDLGLIVEAEHEEY
jgi:hypothetical protein